MEIKRFYMNKKIAFVITGIVVVLAVGGWYVYSTNMRFRNGLAPVVLRVALFGGTKPKQLDLNQEAQVRLKGMLEKNPQTTISFYMLVGADWSIGLDVSRYQGAPIKDRVGRIVTVEGTQKRLLFIRKSPGGGPDPISRPPIEGDLVVVTRLTY